MRTTRKRDNEVERIVPLDPIPEPAREPRREEPAPAREPEVVPA